MTLMLCSILQDSIPLLGSETKFSFELILCITNQLLVSKVIFIYIVASLDLQDKKLVFFQGASKVSYILGYNGTKYKAKSFLQVVS